MVLEKGNEWLGRRVGVYGFGKTGRACVDYLLPRLITPVVLLDRATPEQQAALVREAQGRFDLLVGEAVAPAIEQLDTLILSPGVPPRSPNVQRAVERGVLVISELELAARHCPGYILAVTGTNGKSTTTKMLGHVLSAIGPTHVLGNIGSPLLGSLDQIGLDDFVALEVSSYQLEGIDRFAPRVAIYTNLTPDHLDRHGTMEEYGRVKRSMTRRMGEGDFVITNALCDEFAPERFDNQLPTFLQYRSLPGNRIHGAWSANQQIEIDLGTEQFELPLDCIKLPGVHNLENALAVILATMLVGATPQTIIDQLSTFTGFEHRLELCRTAGGLKFYNDSKATNPEATVIALRAMEQPLALILGGRDKLTDLSELAAWMKRKVGSAVLYGEAAERFAHELTAAGYTSFETVANLEQAVDRALAALKPGGGTVLLSPACASFDQYSSFEERGEHFKRYVASLAL